MNAMGRAGQVLKQILDDYAISQTDLADRMGIGRANIYRWMNEVRDPNSETLVSIIRALRQIDPQAADDFKQRYMNGL